MLSNITIRYMKFKAKKLKLYVMQPNIILGNDTFSSPS